MAEKKSLGKEFTKGLIKENPVLRLVPDAGGDHLC